jgi:hypothetical protein
MLGQHPEMFGLPELHLFSARSVSHWLRESDFVSFNMRDGLLRTIALLFYGAQTEDAVECARGWILRRSHCTTGMILEEIEDAVKPKRLVEKSPSIVYRVEYMLRAFRMFPRARFIHLTRHPVGQGESVMKAFQTIRAAVGGAPYWMLNLISYGYWPKTARARREAAALGYHEDGNTSYDVDPQRAWYALNCNIREFLSMVPRSQQIQIRGEEVLQRADQSLAMIADWLEIRSDGDALDRMKHPEHSPFSSMGPANAPLGNDGLFLANPVLRPERVRDQCIEGVVPWRDDGREFLPEVRELTRSFGY